MNIYRLLSITKTELSIALFTFALVLVTVLSSRIGRLSTNSAVAFDQPTEIILHEDQGLEELTIHLDRDSVKMNADELKWAAGILGWRSFKRGRYLFEGGYSYNTLLSKMARGLQDPVSIVILPGSTPGRISDRVAKELHFDSTAFGSILTDSTFLAEHNLTEQALFGRLLPETYLVYWTTSPEFLVNKILRQFEHSVVEEFSGRVEELDINLNEALTMASIIEWESTNKQEKPTISGLYWNRLDRGMLLQADPTVNYALGERRRLTFEDYNIDHPYNTYIHSGLPPAPITNPSLSSIEAALYPEEHNYLYMVASPEGGHVFTRSFEEHKRESAKWRKWIREQYRIKRQKEQEENSGTR